jgi:hypothetical protein
MCIGCAYSSKEAKRTTSAKKTRPSYFVHTVRWPGETLSIIAKWYTGNHKKWKALAEANPKLNPNRIFKGNKIRVPKDLLKTRKPMPQKFIAKITSKPKKKPPPSKPAPPPKEEKEPELFGPKEYPMK